MIRFKTVTMRNFLSVGNVTQAVNLDENGLTLVLGENLDLGGGGSRNGVGKTTLIQAIYYAIYGVPLTNIKKDNLINKTNQKNMVVSLDYEIDGQKYRIERGRKPNFIRYMVDDGLVNSPDTDESHGESKWTQAEIERKIGMSHLLSKHILALHTKTVPFLSDEAKKQRDIIEELLGITQLTSKAIRLKEQAKEIKDEIKTEEVRIKTLIESNEKIQRTINDLHFKSSLWEREHAKKLEKLSKAIEQMLEVDIELEIKNHTKRTSWLSLTGEINRFEADLTKTERHLLSTDNQLQTILEQRKSAKDKQCPTCEQTIHDGKHERILEELTNRSDGLSIEKSAIESELFAILDVLESKTAERLKLGEEPQVIYTTVEQAFNHRHTLDKLTSDLERESKVESPFIDQIAALSTNGLVQISYEYLNELTRVKEHQDFLLKLLSSKDSFIRKKIIDQNLNYLNNRLNHYLEKLALPHEVLFQSDLSVEITNLGKEYDFDSLSNGEANRLVLALAWSFRDVWETMNRPMNLLMIDELVDSGMDSHGMDSALEVLKRSARERGKNIFLISHKDELVSRVGKILLVQKENGFTTFAADVEENG